MEDILSDRITQLCGQQNLPLAEVSILSMKVKRATPETVAIAAAQANLTTNINVPPSQPVINVHVEQPSSQQVANGDSGDTNGDKDKKFPEDDTILKAIAHVNNHRKEAKLGRAEQLSLKKIICDFVGPGDTKEVDRIYRALKPDRYGWMILPE